MTDDEHKGWNKGIVAGLMLGLVVTYWLARYSGI